MTNWFLMTCAFLTGALVPLQLAFNAQLGGVTRNAFTASLIVFLIGAVAMALVTLVLRPQLPTLNDLAAAPKTIWIGGLIATVYILAIVILTPKLGVGLTTSLILIGQLITAIALDHFGAFGTPQHQINFWRIAGVSMMIAGVITIKAN